MPTRPVRLRVCALVLAFLAVAGACGREQKTDAGQPGEAVTQLEAPFIPTEVLGLRVTPEDSKPYLDAIKRSYMEQFGLYAFRNGELLQATLQVTKFTTDAKHADPAFQAQLVGQIGSSKAQVFRMDDTEIHLTTGTKQQIGIWFRDRYMFVMSIRDEYVQPRTLLRQALGFKP